MRVPSFMVTVSLVMRGLRVPAPAAAAALCMPSANVPVATAALVAMRLRREDFRVMVMVMFSS
jgi:hypothetical protein